MVQRFYSYLLTGLLALLSLDAFAQPTANFTAAPTSGCAPLVVQFTNTSTGTGLTYSWTFGNGNSSVNQNPSTIYLAAGAYTVSLTVTDANGLSNTKTQTNYITVAAQPVVSFYATDTVAACGPKTVQFVNQTTLNATGGGTYKWDFGDGSPLVTTTTAGNVSHTYDTCGTFTVSLIATNSLGCSQIFTRNAYISVYCDPVAAFTASNNNSCTAPVTTTFNASSSQNAVSYQWNFGDGPGLTAPSASPTATHTYNTLGSSYTVRLVVTSANGCKDTLIQPAFVNIGALVSSFAVSSNSVCTGNPVYFTNTTTPGAGNSLWQFNGSSMAAADISTETSPSHTYSIPGTYVVKLTSTYNNCSDTQTTTITVAQGPTIAFTGSPLGSCNPPLLVNFTNGTTGAASYTWNFGDGSPTSSAANPAHNYTSPGQYNVSLIATTAGGTCSDTLIKPNYVKIFQPTTTINGNVNLGCAPALSCYTLSITSPVGTTGFSYTWNWGDGSPNTVGPATSACHTYNNPGAYTITVTGTGGGTTSGCTFTSTKQVFVGVEPTAAFSIAPNDTVCYGTPITFTSNSTGVSSIQWFFGDGSNSVVGPTVTKSYGNPGTYIVMLVANNFGCRDTIYDTVRIQEPKAQFEVDLQNCSDRFTFCYTNTSISSGPTTYAWDFGVTSLTTDVSSLQNPCYTFPSTPTTATYNVKLTVTNLTTGCVNTKTIPVKVFPLQAAFTTSDSTLCKGESTTFTATANANYTKYIWSYGDGTGPDTLTTNTTSHIYDIPGTFTVKLTVVDTYGCTVMITKTNHIKVTGINNLNFTATPLTGCRPLVVSFGATGTPLNGTITNYTWNFGQVANNTNTGTNANPTYTYTVRDTFSVKLIVTLTGGCKDSLTKDTLIKVTGPNAAPTIAGGNKRCVGAPVQFSNNSTGTSMPLSYNWNFGDPASGALNSSNAIAPQHTYNASGTYQVRLIATDPQGCIDTTFYTVNISTIDADFIMSANSAECAPLSVNFTNTSDTDQYGPTTYLWNFGNGLTTSLPNPSTTFTAPGTFTVKLIVFSSYGCKDSTTQTVTINTGPTAVLSYQDFIGCADATRCFTISNIQNTTAATIDYEDGTTQALTLPPPGTPLTVCHTYTSGGNFTPIVVLSNGGTGCVTIIDDPSTITVGAPLAGFKAVPATQCANSPVQFTDTSSTPALTITSWNWDFGVTTITTDVSTLQNPTYTYTAAGTYTVRLIVSDTSGCSDTAFRTVTILAQPTINAGPDQAICVGNSVTLNATGGVSYVWTPNPGDLSCYNCASPVADPASTTTYTVVGTASNGCTKSDQVTVSVFTQPAVPTVVTPITYCQGATAAALTATTSGAGYTLNWYPNATSTTPISTPTPSTATPGTFTWYVSQASPASAGGCEGPRTAISVVINPTPAPPVVNSPVQYCRLATATPLTATATAGNSLVWYATATSTTPISTPTPSTATVGSTTYYVSQQSSNGCESARSSIEVIINPLPVAPTTTSPDTLCQFDPSSPLTASTAGSNFSLQWYATATSPTPIATPTPSTAVAGTFTWYVSQKNNITGCEGNRAAFTIVVNPKPNVDAGTDATICVGSSDTINVTGAAAYTWTPTVTCLNAPCSSVSVTPAANTTYTVIGTSAGCSDTDQITINVVTNPVVTVTPSAPAICSLSNVSLTAAGASNYTWSPNTGLSATTGATVTANPTTTTTYTVIGQAGNNCADTTTVTVTVNPLPAAPVAPSPVNLCVGAPSSALSATATGSNTLVWYTQALGGTPLPSAPAPSTANPGQFDWWVAQVNPATNCEGPRTHVIVNVYALPVVNAGADQTICEGASATLTATGANGYAWSGTNVSPTTGATVTATPTAASTTYTVTGTSTQGCTNTDQVIVYVVPNPVVSVSPSAPAICSLGSVTLTAFGANSYGWSPGTGLNTTIGNTVIASPTTTTTYTVTGTQGSCTGTATVTVTVNPLPAAPAVTTPVTYCQGDVATPLSATATTGNSLVWYLTATSNTPISVPTPSTTNAGNFNWWVAQVNNTTNCEGPRSQITVTVNPTPTVNAGVDVTICNGATASLTATGAATYTWSPAINCATIPCASGTVTPAATTTYTATGTSSLGCSATDQVTVNVISNPVVTVTASPSTTICQGDTVVLTAAGGNTYSWSPNVNISATSGNPVSVWPTATTTYLVTGFAGSNCQDTESITITVNPLPVAPTVTTPVTFCQGAAATALSATATAGNGIVWFTTATGGTPSATTPIPNTTTAGPQTFYAAQQNNTTGCIGPRTPISVTINPKPNVVTNNDTAFCAGATITLVATGAANYVWDPAVTCSGNCATATVTPAATTTYTVIGTSAQNCSDTDLVTLTVVPNPIVTVSPTSATICPTASAILTASGATSYTWTGPNLVCDNAPTCSQVTVTPPSTSTYVATGVVTVNGVTCSDTQSVQVVVSNTPIITFTGDTSVCVGSGGTTLTASGATTFTWLPAGSVTCVNPPNCSTVSMNPSTTTTYTVIGATGVGCIDTVTVTVTVNPLPVLTATTSTPNVCPADTAFLAASPATGITYTWSPTVTCTGGASCATAYANPLVATTYTATGTDVNGCQSTATVSVGVLTPSNVSASATPTTLCPGDSTQLLATGAVNYLWYGVTTGISNVNSANPMAAPPATMTYFVKGTDGQGCRDTASVTVTVLPKPVVNAGPDVAICATSCTNLSATGAVSYTWTPTNTLSNPNIATPQACPTATTIYTVIGVAANGCKDTDAVQITINPLPVISAGPDRSICMYDTAHLSVTPTTGLATFFWTGAGLSNISIANPVASPQTTTTYTVAVFDTNNCSDTDDVTITVLPLPTVDAGADQQICRYTSAQLNATGGVSYQWSSPNNSLSDTDIPNPVATPPANTVYTVIGTGANGCTDTDQVSVTLFNQVPLDAGPDLTICEGQSTQLNASGSASYQWSPATYLSNPNIYNPIATPDTDIQYTVIGTDNNGCKDTDDIRIMVFQRADTSIKGGGEVCEGQSLQLFASGGTSYLWIPSDGLNNPTISAPIATPAVTTTYQVVITQGNCFVDTLRATVIVHPVPDVELGPDREVLSGSSYTFNPAYIDVDTGSTYTWTPTEALSCLDCPNPTATPGATTTYSVVVVSPFGCSDSDNITLTVVCSGDQVWLPNTFTPDGDGQNDRFYAHGRGISEVKYMRIYSRWGEVVYEARNFPIDDINYSWDGTFNGVPLKPDVYIYVIEATCGTGTPIMLKGDVTIMR